jgi:hypothetical protein
MKALSILALATATFAAPMAWAGQTAVTVTQVAGPMTSVVSGSGLTIFVPDAGGQLIFVLQATLGNTTE